MPTIQTEHYLAGLLFAVVIIINFVVVVIPRGG